MDENKKLKIFISYSHEDNLETNHHIDDFKKHCAMLVSNNMVDFWYDREIFPGENFQDKIDNNLEDADIICLFISSNFLNSNNCMKEKEKAFDLKIKKKIKILPIILSPCAWKDEKNISPHLALPIDGKPISKYSDLDEGWFEVYKGLKKVAEKEINNRNIKISEKFNDFLNDTEMLKKAHSEKKKVLLDDIFIYPEFYMYDDENSDRELFDSKELFENILEYPKIIIVGDDQSGKTTLCKKLFKLLYEQNFIPVYIGDNKKHFGKNMKNNIINSFNQQYDGEKFKNVDEDKLIPIVDDFHLALNKDIHMEHLKKYSNCIIILDDVYDLNLQNMELASNFTHFKINELKPSLRSNLIQKWISLTDKTDSYELIDQKTDLINNFLGKNIGHGLMPIYPFFILSAIVTHDTFQLPLDEEITSQGHCYQALIYFYLFKQGVKTDEIDIYLNFLTELSFNFFENDRNELSKNEFHMFIKKYSDKYILPIEIKELMDNLSLIFSKNNLNNYSFKHRYLRYFFTAKYLADNMENDDEIKGIIENMMENLHVNENAYITIFISHHSNNDFLLEKIDEITNNLFNEHTPANLKKGEIQFFDKQIDFIIDAALPNRSNHKLERKKRLIKEDELEESIKTEEEDKYLIEDEKNIEENADIPLHIELRRAIKTVEVIGCLMKNRKGSLEKNQMKNIFEDAMNVHLRFLSSYFDIISDEEGQEIGIDILSKKLKKMIDEKGGLETLSEQKIRKMAGIIFWRYNFIITNSIIYKIIHSLGSDKLTIISDEVCDNINTPASFLIKHGILMWYNKNLQLNEIKKQLRKNNIPLTVKKSIGYMVVDYCSIHKISYKEKKQIESALRTKIETSKTD